MLKSVAQLFFLFLVINHQASGLTTKENDIQDIRKQYNNIVSKKDSFDVTYADIFSLSSEGGEANIYRNSLGEIILIEFTALGEEGKAYFEFYYNKNDVFFVLEIRHEYNSPIYIDQKKSKELGVEAQDDNKTLIAENRYYFKEGKLIRWLDNNKNSISPTDASYEERENKILSYSSMIITEAIEYEKKLKEWGMTD